MKSVIIFGIGKLAELIHYYLTHDSEYTVTAFTVDSNHKDKDEFQGLPVIAFEDVIHSYPPEQYSMFIAISHAKLNSLRKRKYNEAKDKGYFLISYISSKAVIWPELKTGENCMIAEGTIIQPFVNIGNNVIIFAGVSIGHHSQIGSHCFFGPHVVLAGGVKIGEKCFLGMNSSMGEDVKIADESIIGANSLIVTDTKEGGGYISKPTKLNGLPNDKLADMLQPSRGW